MRVKEKDLDMEEVSNVYQNHKKQPDFEEIRHLQSVKNGNKIIGNKEFNMVLYITCFVPFMRPGIPLLKDAEIKAARGREKEKKKKIQAG
mmetsp:Transcript_15412/g.15012  ORF Transcript_15412/g.15012 Transcript_15412/m.15012 type:complete len:90 (-) Transcript_15412:1460-1729(-)